MSFKSLMKQYAGKTAAVTSESNEKQSGKRTINSLESSNNEVQTEKRTRPSTYYFCIVFQIKEIREANDDDGEFFTQKLASNICTKLEGSSFRIIFEPTEVYHYQKEVGRLLIISSSRSIMEAISHVVCKLGPIETNENSAPLRLLYTSVSTDPIEKLKSPSFAIPYIENTVEVTTSIVVARYRESIEWIPSSWKQRVFLYNKAPLHADQCHGFHHVQSLPNLGRESHTYLYHILENYDTLTDIVYFTQAHPFDHAPHFIAAVDSNVGLCRPYQGLSNVTAVVYDLNVRQHESMYSGIQGGFDRTIEVLFGTSFEQPVLRFYPGAIMAVHRSLIHSRPKAFYEKCISLLDKSVDPIEGYAFERIWSIIFDDSTMVYPPVLPTTSS